MSSPSKWISLVNTARFCVNRHRKTRMQTVSKWFGMWVLSSVLVFCFLLFFYSVIHSFVYLFVVSSRQPDAKKIPPLPRFFPFRHLYTLWLNLTANLWQKNILLFQDLAKQEDMDIKSFSASTGETYSTKNRYRDILPCEYQN